MRDGLESILPDIPHWGHSYELISDEDWSAFDAKIGKLTADPEAAWADLPLLFEHRG